MSARPGRKAELERLREENRLLREREDLVLSPDPDATFLGLAQDVRDTLAVRVLWIHCGDMFAALRHLGFDTKEKSDVELRAMAVKVFDTAGVRERMSADLSNAEGQKQAMIARQVQIALHGTDENSTRAFITVARTLGWEKNPDRPQGSGVQVNIWGLLGEHDRARERNVTATIDAAKPHDPLAILGHDPGAPVKVDVSEDLGLVGSDG